jgi:hypothetical protein
MDDQLHRLFYFTKPTKFITTYTLVQSLLWHLHGVLTPSYKTSFRFCHQTHLCIFFLRITCYNGTRSSMSAVRYLPETQNVPSQQWMSVTSPLQYTVKQHYFTPCLQQHWRSSRRGRVQKALWDTAAVQITPIRRTQCDSGARVLAETTTISGVASQDGSPSCAMKAWTTYMVRLWGTTWLLVLRFVPQCCYIEKTERKRYWNYQSFKFKPLSIVTRKINILLRILNPLPIMRQKNSVYITKLYDFKIYINIIYRYMCSPGIPCCLFLSGFLYAISEDVISEIGFLDL